MIIQFNKAKKCTIAALISLLLVFSTFAFPRNADAAFSVNDKLYGETFSQRGMNIAYCPNITAQYAAVMDKDGRLIYERNSTDGAKIASMTKIMTAIVALEHGNMNDELTISEAAAEVGESSAGLWQDDKLNLETALYALMVPSGNDAAVAIAEFIGQKLINEKDPITRLNNDASEDEDPIYMTDNIQAFVALMNKEAEELGCENSCFTNPHGLDDEKWANDSQRSCAKDMVVITRYAMQNQLFRKIVSGGDTDITVSRNGQLTTLKLTSTDILLGNYEGCIGVKTGHTEIAGACFSGACTDASGSEIYTVVMNSSDESQRFVDTQDLFNWYYINKVDYRIADSNVQTTVGSGEETKSVGVVAQVAHPDWVDCTIPVTTQDQNYSVPILSIAGNIHQEIDDSLVGGSYKEGDYVCDLTITQHNVVVATVPLYATDDQAAPNIFQIIGTGIDRLFRSISGQATQASTKIVNNVPVVNN